MKFMCTDSMLTCGCPKCIAEFSKPCTSLLEDFLEWCRGVWEQCCWRHLVSTNLNFKIWVRFLRGCLPTPVAQPTPQGSTGYTLPRDTQQSLRLRLGMQCISYHYLIIPPYQFLSTNLQAIDSDVNRYFRIYLIISIQVYRVGCLPFVRSYSLPDTSGISQLYLIRYSYLSLISLYIYIESTRYIYLSNLYILLFFSLFFILIRDTLV